jgi:murein DD-endopeptidase MepM/ murein hydrolase activator NlpD
MELLLLWENWYDYTFNCVKNRFLSHIYVSSPFLIIYTRSCMFRVFLAIALFCSSLLASFVEERKWSKSETFLNFLDNNNLPQSIYYELEKNERELAAEITAGLKFHILRGENNEIEQVLIPITDDIQLHILKDKDDKFYMTTNTVSYQVVEKILNISIKQSPYQDILKSTNNKALAKEFIESFQKSINFRRDIQKNDRLVIVYSQKIRLGSQYNYPEIKYAMIESNKRKNYIFLHSNGRYYNDQAKEIESFLLTQPCRYTRISDKFSKKRWHPILKRYRAHLGIDYAAPRGTPVKSAGDGKIIHVGRKGGYGKTVIIQHSDGYKTLYAHLNGYRKGIKRGKYVKKKQLIGYVGSTGLSTGPHLHFGLYKNGRAINPNSVVRITKEKLNGKDKKAFLASAEKSKQHITDILESNNNFNDDKLAIAKERQFATNLQEGRTWENSKGM